jgi:iron complex outermembrane receptor protein
MTESLQRLVDEKLSILVEQDGKELYRSTLPGVRPLLEMVDRFPDGLEGADVADRVVGGCAARVFVLLGVKKVRGMTGSESAVGILSAAAIEFSFDRTVADIRNRDDTDSCPFEKLSREHEDPAELVAAMRVKLEQLRAGR